MENIKYLIFYIIIVNIYGFIIMGYDKNLARNHKRRISENTLFMTAFLLGAIGIYCGMFKFRHKTKHTSFLVLVPILFILNIISVYYIISYIA